MQPLQQESQPGQPSIEMVELEPKKVYSLKPLTNDLTRMLGGMEGNLTVSILDNGMLQLYNADMREALFPVQANLFNIEFVNGRYVIPRILINDTNACDLTENREYLINQVRKGNNGVEIGPNIIKQLKNEGIVFESRKGFMVADQFRSGFYYVVLYGDRLGNLHYADHAKGSNLLATSSDRRAESPESFLEVAMDVMAWISECGDLTGKAFPNVCEVMLRTVLPRLVATMFTRIDKIGELSDRDLKAIYDSMGMTVHLNPFTLYVFKRLHNGMNIVQVNTAGEFLSHLDPRYYTQLVTENTWEINN